MRLLIALLVALFISFPMFAVDPMVGFLTIAFTLGGGILFLAGEALVFIALNWLQERSAAEGLRQQREERARREAEDPLIYQRDDLASLPF